MNQQQFQKLPAYARDAWAALMSEKNHYLSLYTQAISQKPTRVRVDPYSDFQHRAVGAAESDQPRRYLADFERISFQIGGGEITVGLRAISGVFSLEIMCTEASGKVAVLPAAANCFHVAVVGE